MILVIDDNALICETLQDCLGLEGLAVETAHDGQRGLAMLQQGRYDLVISDIKMPGLSGLDVLRAIKQRGEETEVILMTGFASLETAVEALRLGAYDYILKPFEHVDLVLRTIRRALEKQALRREVARQQGELQAAYERLRALEALRTDLTNMVVHDLRLPLFALMGCLEHLEQAGGLEATAARMVALARKAGQQMIDQITEMLDIAKLEEGRLPLARAATGIGPLIASCLEQVAGLAVQNGVALSQDASASLPPVPLDAAVIRRVLLNLLTNALKFTPEGGRVAVRAAADREALRVEVADTGMGFESALAGRIFDKFTQAEGRQRGFWLGIGLGLTFCKLAVEAHGGRIEARSAPGRGSTFSFDLPLAPAPSPLAAGP